MSWNETGKIGVVVNCYSNGMCMPELIFWFLDIGVPHENIIFNTHDRDVGHAYCMAVNAALQTKFDKLIFADCDLMPHTEGMKPFFEMDADFVSCVYDTEGKHPFAKPDSFHTGIWRCERDKLEKVWQSTDEPLFRYKFKDKGTYFTHCACKTFCEHVRNVGYTTGHAGFALHHPRSKKRADFFHPARPLDKF